MCVICVARVCTRSCHTKVAYAPVPFPPVKKCPISGTMRGVPARWGDPARGTPRLLDPVQAEEHHEPGPLPSPPPAPLWEGARGKGSRLERGSRLVAFSNCERFGRGNTTSRVPPTSRDALSLLTFCTKFFLLLDVRAKNRGLTSALFSWWPHPVGQ